MNKLIHWIGLYAGALLLGLYFQHLNINLFLAFLIGIIYGMSYFIIFDREDCILMYKIIRDYLSGKKRN